MLLCLQAYRFYAGIGVEMKCETALTYYRKVASAGKSCDVMAWSWCGGEVWDSIDMLQEGG